MAKIIVTAYPGPYQQPEKRIIDADVCEFKGSHGGGTHVILEHGGFTVKESIEEIQKLINEAEAQATNKKLDEILQNQRQILENQRWFKETMEKEKADRIYGK